MIQHDSASIQLVRSSLSLPHSGLLPQMNQSVLTVAAPHFLSMILRNLQGLFAGSLPHRKALNLLNDIKSATKICRSFCLKCNLQQFATSLQFAVWFESLGGFHLLVPIARLSCPFYGRSLLLWDKCCKFQHVSAYKKYHQKRSNSSNFFSYHLFYHS